MIAAKLVITVACVNLAFLLFELTFNVVGVALK